MQIRDKRNDRRTGTADISSNLWIFGYAQDLQNTAFFSNLLDISRDRQ